jgi:hypothetical protein
VTWVAHPCARPRGGGLVHGRPPTSGFSERELGRLHTLVEENRERFEAAWHESFAPER